MSQIRTSFFLAGFVATAGCTNTQSLPQNDTIRVDDFATEMLAVESIEVSYVLAFCNVEMPFVRTIIKNQSEDGGEDTIFYMCVPNEGAYAIDIFCTSDDCSQGITQLTTKEFTEQTDLIIEVLTSQTTKPEESI